MRGDRPFHGSCKHGNSVCQENVFKDTNIALNNLTLYLAFACHIAYAKNSVMGKAHSFEKPGKVPYIPRKPILSALLP